MKIKQMSIKELAALIGVSTDTVRRAARSGLIPSTRVGTAYRFDSEKVRLAMRARAQQRPIDGAKRPARQPARAGGAEPNRPRTVTRGH
jgi:excisionase family DNA binding protein